jgi:hypothetical protein
VRRLSWPEQLLTVTKLSAVSAFAAVAALLLTPVASAQAVQPKRNPGSVAPPVYLMSAFRDGDQSLLFLVSDDARHWRALPAATPYTDTTGPNASGGGIRDPSVIAYGGKVWVAYTYAGGGNASFGVAASPRLTRGWTKVASVSTTAIAGAFLAWAPEWVHNPDGSPWLLNGLPAIVVTALTDGPVWDAQPVLVTPTDSTMTAWRPARAIAWPGHQTGGAASEVGTTATLRFAHVPFLVDQAVIVSGCSVPQYDGLKKLAAVTATTVQFWAGPGLAPATGCVADVIAIDFYPLVSGGRFWLFGKDGGYGDKVIFTVAGRAVDDYTKVVDWRALGRFGAQDIEAPSVIQMAKSRWEMMVDLRTDQGLQYATARSPAGPWSARRPMTMPAPYYNHGTIIRVGDPATFADIVAAQTFAK